MDGELQDSYAWSEAAMPVTGELSLTRLKRLLSSLSNFFSARCQTCSERIGTTHDCETCQTFREDSTNYQW